MVPKTFPSLRTIAAFLLAGGGLNAAEPEAPAPIAPVVPLVLEADLEALAAPVGGSAGAAAPGAATPCTVCNPAFDFSKVPTPRALQLVGPRPMLPTGPGYYSALDQLRGQCRQAPPKYPYPRFGLSAPSNFDIPFNYLDDPKNTEHDYADPLKRMKIGDDWMLSLGGQAWGRYMNEYNSRLGRVDNDYFLYRTRVNADLWYKDIFRFYVEGIHANTVGQSLPPLLIDGTGTDFLNLFMEAKLGEYEEKPVYARVGRQELNLGSQRLVSTLDWANTRRTFQGASVYRNGDKWDSQFFWVQPVIPNFNQLDWADTQQNFAGGYVNYRPAKGQSVEFYNYAYVNNNSIVQRGLQRGNISMDTIGARYTGDKNNVLWDVEAAGQFGRTAGQNVAAAMATVGLGYNAKELAWHPTFWAYYDYATGDGSPNSGNFNTFNQLFPFGHYYMGWADLIGRQNIQDLNFHMYLYPTKWITFWTQYHIFQLANARDALYNTAGNVSRFDPTGRAGRNVGQELDFIVNFHLTNHSDVMAGYSHLFAGSFIRNTAPAGQRDGFDSSTFFVMYNYKW
jgi:hypothetical protein